MGKPQREIIQAVPIEPEFSDLFEVPETEVVAGHTQVVPDPALEPMASPTQVVPDHSHDGVSLEEAAKILRLHTDTIKKRLRKGSLKGFKVAEKYGDKWLVSRAELPAQYVKAVPDPTQNVPDHSLEVVASPTQIVPDPTFEAVASPVHVVPDHTLTNVASPTHSLADHRLVDIIENQAHQLKAAGDVIMYLRSQIEEKHTELTQLKLLTDNQHKRSRWTRFCSWFFKV